MKKCLTTNTKAVPVQNITTTSQDDNFLFYSNRTTRKVYELFKTGEELTVVGITLALHIPDPRSHIRDIRNAGIQISDYWVYDENSRHKVYFLKK
jgi:Helix-turn-helix domain